MACFVSVTRGITLTDVSPFVVTPPTSRMTLSVSSAHVVLLLPTLSLGVRLAMVTIVFFIVFSFLLSSHYVLYQHLGVVLHSPPRSLVTCPPSVFFVFLTSFVLVMSHKLITKNPIQWMPHQPNPNMDRHFNSAKHRPK